MNGLNAKEIRLLNTFHMIHRHPLISNDCPAAGLPACQEVYLYAECLGVDIVHPGGVLSGRRSTEAFRTWSLSGLLHHR